MTQPYDHDRLVALGRRRKRAIADLNEIRPELTKLVEAAGRERVPQVRVVDVTGLTRDQVRKIWRSAGIEAQS